MEIVHLDNTHSVGLGDNLCLISLLAQIPESVKILVSNQHQTFDRLVRYKRIFKIPDHNLKIELVNDNGNFKNVGWSLKLFCDYYKPKTVEANEQNIPTITDRDMDKRCVAVAGFFDDKPENNNNEWPWCKQRPLNYWAEIYAWLKKNRYEVITVDYHDHDLENKIELMTRYCCALISYEGGMAHLGHMINLPVFLVDWTYPAPSTNLDRFHCEFVHRTDSVYILRKDQELFSWNREDFNRKIIQLRSGDTNNRIVNGDCKFKFQGPGLYGPLTIRDKFNKVLLETSGLFDRRDVAANFVNKFFMRD